MNLTVAQFPILGEPEEARALFSSADLNAEYGKHKQELAAKIPAQLADLEKAKNEQIAQFQQELDGKLKLINDKYSAMSMEERSTPRAKKEYKDEVDGAKIVCQRAILKLNAGYDRDVMLIKSQSAILLQAKNQLAAEAAGKQSDGVSLGVAFLNAKASFNLKKTLTDKKIWMSLSPLLVLLALFAAYFAACRTTGYTMNIDTILRSGVYVAIVSVGAVFIYSQGAFDMSLGNACLVCAAAGIMVFSATGSILLTLVVGVALGVLLGVINAVLANCLHMPVMVMTLTMQSILSAVYATMTASSGGYIEVQYIRVYGNASLKWTVLVIFAVFCVILFNYTKIGRRDKMIGGNATCAQFTGIDLMKAGIISFAVSGIGLGLCGFLYITQMGSVNTGSVLTSVGLNVIIAINLGGMPTSGGPKSRISAALIGGFFCTILDELFAAMYLSNWMYLAKGIVFLVAVCLTSLGDRPKRLPS